ncbi:unnamed protein product [marine sediment metagenome]|uniref:Uncharacterized protein n=1 Tax=marine sediment metagenome TaxID=412755 RepID=X1LQ12_9ZZZZ
MPTKAVDLVKPLSTTQVMVLDKNPARVYALFVNDGAELVYLGLGIPAIANRGPRLNANGGSYEINFTNPWHGSVSAIAKAGTPNLTIQEW